MTVVRCVVLVLVLDAVLVLSVVPGAVLIGVIKGSVVHAAGLRPGGGSGTHT